MSNIIKSTRINISSDEKYNIELPSIDNNDFLLENSTKEDTDIFKENTNALTSESIIHIAKNKAETIINQAQKTAEQIINQAIHDADVESQQIKETAEKEGYNNAIEEVNSIKNQIQLELESTIIEKEETLKAIEPKIINMVLKISKSIFGNILDINPQAIIMLIKKGLSESNTTGKIFIHISKHDYEIAQTHISELYEFVGNNSEMEISKDLSLDKGDCIIETQFGNIDCSFEQQFESIKNELIYILENR